MTARFVVVAQWQGSGSSRSMRLVDGADAIRGDLPTSSTSVVEIPLEAGDAQGTAVHRLSSVALVRDRFAEVLAHHESTVITIGGDCGVELAAVVHAARDSMAVLWVDAHPDLNTPESSPSGAFSGMVLRTLLGDGPATLVPAAPLSADRVVLAGVRSIDPGEDQYIAENSIATVVAGDISGNTLVAALEATGATSVYIHVDLDVIDPGDVLGVSDPAPFGVLAPELLTAIKAVVDRFPLAGAGITQFAPRSPQEAVNDLPTILRLVGVLAAAS